MDLAPATALFTRSLMLRTRAASVAWMRVALGAALFLVLMGVEHDARHSAAGRTVLSIIAYLSVWALAIPALTSFSSAITEEKEENAIGLLRMAGLDPLGILLAKSTARLLEVGVLMAITLPVALLAVTLGGVTAVQVLAVYVALGTWLVLLANLALFWSVVCRTSSTAASATVLTLLVTPISFMLLVQFTGSRESPLMPLATWLGRMLVSARLGDVLNTGYAGPVAGLSDLVHVLAAAVLFLAAWRLFPRFAVDADGGEGARPVLRMGAGRRRPFLGALLGSGRPPPGLAALTWKDFHFLAGGRLGQGLWMMAMIGLAVLVAWMSDGRRHERQEVMAGFLMVTVLLLLPVQVGLILGRLFSEERRLGTVGDILGLPYRPSAMVYAKLACLRWPLLSTALVLGTGVVLAPQMFLNGCSGFFAHGVGFAVIGGVLCFWHWCAYLSMCLKGGAFISAVVVTVGSFVVLVMLVELGRLHRLDGSTFAGFVLVFYGVQVVVLHAFLRERFRRMVAD